MSKAANGTGKNLEKMKAKNTEGFKITNASEKTLALTILRLPEQVDMVSVDLKLNRLCDLLYDTSTAVSGFYNDKACKVVG